MKVSVKDGKSCEKILNIEVAEDEIKKEYDEFYQAVRPKAKIPGFRPGKVPRNVLEMHFKGEAKNEVLNHLLNHTYRHAVQEKALEPLGFPEIENVDFKDTRLTYTAKIETRPKIKLSRVTGLAAKKEKPVLKPEELEEALKKVQESLTQFKAVEDRTAAMSDVVIADYVCTIEGKEVEKRSDEWMELKEKEFFQGFSSQLVGAKIGEDWEVKVTFPESSLPKEFSGKPAFILAGKPAIFKMKIKEIKAKILPALDDELAKQAGEFQTLAELKAKIEKDLLGLKEKEAERNFEKALLEELLKHNKFELPEGVIRRRFEHLVEEHLSGHQGRPQLDEAKLSEARESLRKDLEPEARRQVHLAFILDEIANKEGLTVTEADLKAKYEETAASLHQSVEKIEEYYRGREDAIESLKDRIRSEKSIKHVKKNAKISG